MSATASSPTWTLPSSPTPSSRTAPPTIACTRSPSPGACGTASTPDAPRVALDIETLDLLPRVHDAAFVPRITCVCMVVVDVDGVVREEHALRMLGVPPAELAANTALILATLDGARCLIGYNLLQFDLECLRRALPGVSEERFLSWILKAVDPLVPARAMADAGCRMQAMLQLNGFADGKLADGLEAVRMAEEGRWDELLAYCLEDARLVLRLVVGHTTTTLTAQAQKAQKAQKEGWWLRLSPHMECRGLAAGGRAPPQFRALVRLPAPPSSA